MKEPSYGPTDVPPKQEKIGEHGTWVNGQFVRNYKSTNRPADMDSFQWNSLDKKRKQIVKDNFLKYGKSFPTVDIANAVLCRTFMESQEVDLELLTDSVDAIQDNELVYVDELPDGSPYFVAPHGLSTFETSHCNMRRRPLVQRGTIDYSVENFMAAPSTSYSSHSRDSPQVAYPRTSLKCLSLRV